MLNIINNAPPVLPSDMDFSQDLRDFITACLTKDVRQQLQYKQPMGYEFIKHYNGTMVSPDELGMHPNHGLRARNKLSF